MVRVDGSTKGKERPKLTLEAVVLKHDVLDITQ